MRQEVAHTNMQRFLSLFGHKHIRLRWECVLDNTKQPHTLYGIVVLATIFKSAIRGGWMLRFALQTAHQETLVQCFVAGHLEQITETAHPSAFISLEDPRRGLETHYRCKAHILCLR